MEVELTLKVTVPDGIGSFMGYGTVAAALVNNVTMAVNELRKTSDVIESYSVVATRPDSTQIGHGWSDSPKPKEDDHTPNERARTASGGMAGGARKRVPPTTRMGRPKTLTDMEASDGQPVREWGNRSPEELHTAGISTRPVGGTDADWTPPRAPKPERKPKTSPVSKGYRPPVVARQRGK